jgi:hypothetical protein
MRRQGFSMFEPTRNADCFAVHPRYRPAMAAFHFARSARD